MIQVPKHIDALVPYQPGKQADEIRGQYGLSRVIKLASNENPIGPSPKAVATAQRAFENVHLYPDGGLKLRLKLARMFEVKVENVMVGAGSESILANLLRAYLFDDEEVLTAEGTFIGLYVLTRSRGVKLRTVPLKNYTYDLEAIADAIGPKTKIVYLANPNNPTGTKFSKAEFEKFMARVPDNVLVIMDEAYYEYAAEFPDYPDSMSYRFDNVATLRTFSKSYGLAALRIGYGFAHEDIVTNVRKVKLPFEPSLISEAAAHGALEDSEFLDRTLTANRAGRNELPKLFDELGIRWFPTAANFFLWEFDSELDAWQMCESLERRGVIVRPLRAFMLPHCLRVTIGTAEQNEILANALREICAVTP